MIYTGRNDGPPYLKWILGNGGGCGLSQTTLLKWLPAIKGIWVVPQSLIDSWRNDGKGPDSAKCVTSTKGLLLGEYGSDKNGWRTLMSARMYIADRLDHKERLVTVVHEFVHMILINRSDLFAGERWIDAMAYEFVGLHPYFMDYVYKKKITSI